MFIQAYFHLVITTPFSPVKIDNGELSIYCNDGCACALRALEYGDKVQIIKCQYDKRPRRHDHLHIIFAVSDFRKLDLNSLVKGLQICTRDQIRKHHTGQYDHFTWDKEYYLKTIAPIGYAEFSTFIDTTF